MPLFFVKKIIETQVPTIVEQPYELDTKAINNPVAITREIKAQNDVKSDGAKLRA